MKRKLILVSLVLLAGGLVMLAAALAHYRPKAKASISPPSTTIIQAVKQAGSAKLHIVRKGDTISDISVTYYGISTAESVAKIAAANNIKNPDRITVGQILNIPSYIGFSVPPALSKRRSARKMPTKPRVPATPTPEFEREEKTEKSEAPLEASVETDEMNKKEIQISHLSQPEPQWMFDVAPSGQPQTNEIVLEYPPNDTQPSQVSDAIPQETLSFQGAAEEKSQKEGRKKMNFKKFFSDPFMRVGRFVKNSYKQIAFTTGILALTVANPPAGFAAGQASQPLMSALVSKQQNPADLLTAPATLAGTYSVPTAEKVDENGRGRYEAVRPVEAMPITYLGLAPYEGKFKKVIESLPRKTTGELGPMVFMEEREHNAIVLVKIKPNLPVAVLADNNGNLVGAYLLYGCRYKGKPYVNRIVLPPMGAPVQAAVVPPTQQLVAQNAAPVVIPSSFKVQLAGFPQPPAVPTETTQNVVYSGKVVQEVITVSKCGNWTCNFKNFGQGVQGIGIGAGAAMAGYGVGFSLPKAWRYSSDRKVDAAKARVPDSTTINNNNNPVANGGNVVDSGNSQTNVETTANSESNPTIGPITTTSSSSSDSDSAAAAAAAATATVDNNVENNPVVTIPEGGSGNNHPPDNGGGHHGDGDHGGGDHGGDEDDSGDDCWSLQKAMKTMNLSFRVLHK